MAAKANANLLSYGSIEGDLVLAGVERFECQMGIRQNNAQQPRTYFAS